MTEPLWQPSAEQIRSARMTAFMRQANEDWGLALADYEGLYDFSLQDMEKFWQSFWRYAGVIADPEPGPVLIDPERMPGASFFPEARLNFAENLLRRRDDADALVFWGEDKVKRRLTFRELYDRVSRLSRALAALGIREGDRVAGFMPNMPETIIATLAASSLGAIWSSCSPDFGTSGVLDRFGQIEPKVLFCPDGYYYNGKSHDSLARVAEVAAQLPSL